MIATWTQLVDGSWGVRVQGVARPGSIVVVRFKDAREPSREIVRKVLAVREQDGQTISICSIERETAP